MPRSHAPAKYKIKLFHQLFRTKPRIRKIFNGQPYQNILVDIKPQKHINFKYIFTLCAK